MKSKIYKARFYRKWAKAADLLKTHICVEETDLHILTNKSIDKKWFKKQILAYRQDIQNYISRDKSFFTTIKPISIELTARDIVKEMAKAARLVNVGPMAAVAGAIAQRLAEDLLARGCSQVIIENGGDIFLTKQNRGRLIGVFTGDSKFSGRLSLLIRKEQTPCGICTSSATFGHSLNFGLADSAVVLAKNGAVADAVATAVCNMVKSEKDFSKTVAFAKNVPGVFGILIILGKRLVSWGKIQIKFS